MTEVILATVLPMVKGETTRVSHCRMLPGDRILDGVGHP